MDRHAEQDAERITHSRYFVDLDGNSVAQHFSDPTFTLASPYRNTYTDGFVNEFTIRHCKRHGVTTTICRHQDANRSP